MRKHEPLTDEQKRRIWEAIENIPSIELTLLKAHLLLEYWLNENILDEFTCGEFFLKRFPYFSQKLDVLEACGRLNFPGICQQLRAINAIRNDISHELFPKDLGQKVLAIPCKDVYGLIQNKNLDINNPQQRLLGLTMTLVVQLGNWSDRKKHEWAAGAMH